MSAALLPADHRDRTIEVLRRVQDKIRKRADRAKREAKEHNDAHRFIEFEKAFGMQCAYGDAMDDVAETISEVLWGRT